MYLPHYELQYVDTGKWLLFILWYSLRGVRVTGLVSFKDVLFCLSNLIIYILVFTLCRSWNCSELILTQLTTECHCCQTRTRPVSLIPTCPKTNTWAEVTRWLMMYCTLLSVGALACCQGSLFCGNQLKTKPECKHQERKEFWLFFSSCCHFNWKFWSSTQRRCECFYSACRAVEMIWFLVYHFCLSHLIYISFQSSRIINIISELRPDGVTWQEFFDNFKLHCLGIFDSLKLKTVLGRQVEQHVSRQCYCERNSLKPLTFLLLVSLCFTSERVSSLSPYQHERNDLGEMENILERQFSLMQQNLDIKIGENSDNRVLSSPSKATSTSNLFFLCPPLLWPPL